MADISKKHSLNNRLLLSIFSETVVIIFVHLVNLWI